MAKSKYETHVKPYLAKIKEYKRIGATDKQICSILGISQDRFYAYQKKYVEFSEAVKKGTTVFVMDLKGNLAKLAQPHTLETKKQYIKADPETGKKVQYTEITVKEVDPNPAAIHLLLKNLDKENWADDPQVLSLRQQELELRKSIAKAQHFDYESPDDEKGE